jgi:L-amino acid N-acyltransferase YncA
MMFAVRTLRLRRFVAKIGEGNAASLKLFQYLVRLI